MNSDESRGVETADWKRRVSASLITMGVILIFAAAPRFAPDSVLPMAEEVHAQGTGAFHAHLPWTARNADISVDPSPPWQPDADFVVGGPAWTVDVVGDVAYVGVGAHLLAYDISSADSMPLLGASPPLSGSVRDVVVRDGYAYAAIGQAAYFAGTVGGLFVLDVSDPAAMDVVAVRTVDGGATKIDLDGDRVLVTGLADWAPFSLVVFDISEPLGPLRTGLYRDVYIRGEALLRDQLVYSCPGELIITDLTDPPDPVVFPRIDAPCARMVRLEAVDLIAVVSDSASSDGDVPTVRILNVSDPLNPIVIGQSPLFTVDEYSADFTATDVSAVGLTIYVSGSVEGIGGIVFEIDASSVDDLSTREWALDQEVPLAVDFALAKS